MSSQEKEPKEPLLTRWSRRKQEARAQPQPRAPEPADAKPMPQLPPVDTLAFESDYKGFMDTRVDEALRRIALKKLFSDPRFNITDGLDDYAENYAALEDLSAAVVEQLQHARRVLRSPEAEEGATLEPQASGGEIEQPEEPATKPAGEPQPLADAMPTEQKSPPKDAGRNS